MAIQLPDLKGRIHIDDSALEKVGNSTQKLGDKLTSTGAMLTKRLTVPIIGAGAAGVKMAMDVDKGLREVNTLFGETGKAAETTFKELQGGVKTLSNEIGIAQDVLVGGLYQAISAGVPKENAFEFMEIAAKAAVAGVTDTETAVDGLTSTLNAFGLDASRAQDVADSMFTTVKGGKTTFEELAASLFQVAPAAAAAGVEFTDVNAALASLTFAGTPTTVATTQLRQAIVELTKDGTKAGDAFKEVSGKTFPEFVAEGGNLKEALDLLKEGAEGSGSSMLDMFGSVEAGQAALTLTGKASEKFGQELDNQADSAGAATAAFEEMEKSGARKLEKTMTRLKNALVDVGNVLLPIVTKIVEKIGELTDKFSKLSPGVQKAVVIFGGLVAAIGPVMFIVGKLLTSFGTLIKVVKAVGIVFRGLALALSANPFVLLIAAVAALAFFIYKNWDEIKAKTIEVWNAIKEWLSTAWEAIKTKVTEVWNSITSFFQMKWAWIKNLFDAAVFEIQTKLSEKWEAIKTKISEIWEAIKNFFIKTWANLTHLFDSAVAKIKEKLSEKWEEIKTKVSDIWNGIKTTLSNIWNEIKSTVSTAIENVKTTLSNGWNEAKATARQAWEDLKGAVAEKGEEMLSWIRDLPGKILSALGDMGGLLFGAGKALLTGFWDGAKDIWNNSVKPWLAEKARQIADLKGPIEKDRKLLVPQGQAIIEGLLKGMKAIEPDLIRTLTGMTERISDTQVGVPDLVNRTAGLGDRIRGGVAQTLAASGPAAAMAGGNTYHLHFDGTWDLTNPNQAYEFGEKVVRIIQRVEGAKS